MNSIFRRVSIRKYQEKKIEQEKVEQLLRAAMATPYNKPIFFIKSKLQNKLT